MPYRRTDWTLEELRPALANPVHAAAGPHAHSRIHAAEGELANNPMFQRARVTALVHSANQTDSNASWHAKNPDGSWVHSNNQRKQHPLPKPEASTHSVLEGEKVAKAVRQAFNHPSIQQYLGQLDGGTDMKVHVNFTHDIGRGKIHRPSATVDSDFRCLFIYCKPNPHNKDVPIFQTVVPSSQHKNGGNDPIVTI